MTVIVGILALIGLAVVGASGWAFAQGVRDGLAQWQGAPPGGSGEAPGLVVSSASPLSPAAVLPRSYQAGALAGEVAAGWRSQSRMSGATGAGVSASSSWAAALALGNELNLQRQEAGRAMQAAMAQVLQDNEQAVRAAAGASGGVRSTSDGRSGARNGGGGATEMSGDGGDDGVRGGAAPDTGWYAMHRGGSTSADARPDTANSGDGTEATEAAGRAAWPTHSLSRRPTRCRQQRPAQSDERRP